MTGGSCAVDDLLLEVLHEADLEQFADPLAEKLQVTKLEHFSHVKDADLSAIGLSHPAIKRLKAYVKEKKNSLKRQQKGALSKLKGGKQSPVQGPKLANDAVEETSGVTCLISKNDIKLMEMLGEGSFGVVKRAIWRRSNGKKVDVAVKLLRAFPAAVTGSKEDFSESSLQEINSMHALRHPNLIRLYGLVLSQPIMMVTELCEGGALLDRLRSTRAPVLLIEQLLDYGIQITKGMAYLESKLFIHRDLAARNVLLSSDEKVVKIGDFGLMRTVPNREEHYVMSGQKKVPFAWCPPESLKFKKFSCASDVWAFGVTLWEMFSFGEEPWCGLNGAEILQKVQVGERLPQPDACPSSIFQLVLQCWSLDSANRPTFAALKELLNESVLIIGKCKEAQTGEGLLELETGDRIIIINGNADTYYWYGQNIRSHKLGKFARKNIVLEEPIRRSKILEATNGSLSKFFELGGGGLTSNDISRPIRGSFVHTGHGDTRGGSSWGHADKIDPIFLNNPLWLPASSNLDTERRMTDWTSCSDDDQRTQSSSNPVSTREEQQREGLQGRKDSVPRRNDSYNLANSTGTEMHNYSIGTEVHNFSNGNTSGCGSSSTGGSSGFSGDSDGPPSARYGAPPSFCQYYSTVPPPEYSRPDDWTRREPRIEQSGCLTRPQSTIDQASAPQRLYDEVATEDPFEVPVEVKTLTNRPRYSEMYANIPRLPPPPVQQPLRVPPPSVAISKPPPPIPQPPTPVSHPPTPVSQPSVKIPHPPTPVTQPPVKVLRPPMMPQPQGSLPQPPAAVPQPPSSTAAVYTEIIKRKQDQGKFNVDVERHARQEFKNSALPSITETGPTSTWPHSGHVIPRTTGQYAPVPSPKLWPQYSSASHLPSPWPTAITKPFVHQTASNPTTMLNHAVARQHQNVELMDELTRRLQSANLPQYYSNNPVESSSVGSGSSAFLFPVGSPSKTMDTTSRFLFPSQSSGFTWTGQRTQSVPDVNAISPMDSAPTSGRKYTNVDTHQILDLFDPLSKSQVPVELVSQVRVQAPFACAERCTVMLKRCQLNVQKAVMELKTEKLVDMGLAVDRAQCIRALEMASWDVNAAAEKLLE